MSIPCLTKCQIVLSKTEFPIFKLIDGDSAICYSLPQTRKLESWLAERDFFKSQYGLQKEALDKANILVRSYEELSDKYKLDSEYWKKLARKRNRETAFITSGVGAVASAIIIFLALKK
jgi:hypothetical protein